MHYLAIYSYIIAHYLGLDISISGPLFGMFLTSLIFQESTLRFQLLFKIVFQFLDVFLDDFLDTFFFLFVFSYIDFSAVSTASSGRPTAFVPSGRPTAFVFSGRPTAFVISGRPYRFWFCSGLPPLCDAPVVFQPCYT